VSWRSWPLASGGVQVWLLFGMVFVTFMTIAYAAGNFALAAAGALCVAISAWRLFVPVTFELDAMGITQHILGKTSRIPWTSIDRAEIGLEGVFLAAEGQPLAALRGLYVPWEGQREAVLAQVEYYIPSVVRPVATRSRADNASGESSPPG
jgi:hypothetical protein